MLPEGHLIEDDSIIAKDAHKCSITTPLITINFDTLCHFLGESLQGRFSNSTSVQVVVEEMFRYDNVILGRFWAKRSSKEATLEVDEDENLTDDFGEEQGVCVSQEIGNRDRRISFPSSM